MKRLILACSLAMLTVAAQAHADQNRKPVMDTQQRAVFLQKSLQLNDEQAAKVKGILETGAQQRQALMEKYKPQMDAWRADGKTLREQTEGKINDVLTPKQQEAFKAQLKMREASMHKRMHGTRGMNGNTSHDVAPTQ